MKVPPQYFDPLTTPAVSDVEELYLQSRGEYSTPILFQNDRGMKFAEHCKCGSAVGDRRYTGEKAIA
jgi:hypothetical protein